jgi:hypothetical protein
MGMYLIIGMIIVIFPVMIMGCVAAWREHQNKNEQ